MTQSETIPPERITTGEERESGRALELASSEMARGAAIAICDDVRDHRAGEPPPADVAMSRSKE